MIKILIVDDQAQVRQGLSLLLSTEENLEMVGQAAHGDEACALTDEFRPDVILMDIRMPVCDGIMATRKIHLRHPGTKILVLTTFANDDCVVQALAAGACGYLLKDTDTTQVAQIIRAVHRGHTLLSPTIAPALMARLAAPSRKAPRIPPESLLSHREIEVLKLVSQGKSNREIALILHLTEGTVKNHITAILSQTGTADRTQAALWAKDNIEEDG